MNKNLGLFGALKTKSFFDRYSCNGGVKHLMCQPYDYQLWINMVATLMVCPHNIPQSPIGTIVEKRSILPSTKGRLYGT